MTQPDFSSDPAAGGRGGGYPEQPPPNPAYPNQPYPGPSYPAQPPAQPYPGQPYPPEPPTVPPAQPYPGQPPAQPYPGQPAQGPQYPPQGPSYPSSPAQGPQYPSQPTSSDPNAATQAYPNPAYAQGSYPVSANPVTTGYTTQYGYPGQYPEPPKRRVGPALIIGGLVIVVLLVVFGVGAAIILSAGSKKNNPTTQQTTTSSPTGSAGPAQSSQPASPTAAPFAGDLRTLLVARPSGSTKDSNEGNGSPDGTVTLEQAALTYADPDFGKTHMQEIGYKQGATESWHESGNYSVQIVLFQFRDPEDTKEFVSKLEEGGDSDDFWNLRGDVPNVPTGRFYVSAKANNNGNYNFEIWFAKGTIAGRMNAFAPNRNDVEKLKALALKQYQMLP